MVIVIVIYAVVVIIVTMVIIVIIVVVMITVILVVVMTMTITIQASTASHGLGSRMKTPVLPIWVTCVNDSWGVLFNPNRDLMKSYSAENRFQLYYFSNCLTKEVVKEKKDTILTIDTRGNKTETKSEFKDIEADNDDPYEDSDLLEMAVQTKWEGAQLDWQGIPRYM